MKYYTYSMEVKPERVPLKEFLIAGAELVGAISCSVGIVLVCSLISNIGV